MVAATNEYQLPGQLMPAALEFWKRWGAWDAGCRRRLCGCPQCTSPPCPLAAPCSAPARCSSRLLGLLAAWACSIKVSEDQVVTGIPTPASEAHTPTPAPTPSPASSSCRTVSLAPLLAVVAAAAAALALA